MEKDIIKGGSFLIEEIKPDQVFTPEDFDKVSILVT